MSAFGLILLKNSLVAGEAPHSFTSGIEAGVQSMMGERQVDQGSLFHEFSLERHVPADHPLRAIDRFVDLGDLRARLTPFYSSAV